MTKKHFLESEPLHLKHIETSTVPLCSSSKPFPWNAASSHILLLISLADWLLGWKHRTSKLCCRKPGESGCALLLFAKTECFECFCFMKWLSWPKILFAPKMGQVQDSSRWNVWLHFRCRLRTAQGRECWNSQPSRSSRSSSVKHGMLRIFRDFCRKQFCSAMCIRLIVSLSVRCQLFRRDLGVDRLCHCQDPIMNGE